MPRSRRNAAAVALTALTMGLAACGSLPRTSPTQPAPVERSGS